MRNGADKLRMFTVLTELQRLLGTGPSDGIQQSTWSDFSHRPTMCKQGVRVPGRVLNRLDTGYAIGIGGIVAELPSCEIPPMQHFSRSDIAGRKAFYFYVKQAEFDSEGRPKVVLSLKAQ
jgi:hypothetical protein